MQLNTSALFATVNENALKVLEYYLAGRVNKADIKNLDAGNLDALLPSLQEIVYLAQRYRDVEDSRAGAIKEAQAGRGEGIEVLAAANRAKQHALIEDMKTAHEGLVQSLGENFPEIASKACEGIDRLTTPLINADVVLREIGKSFNARHL